MPCLGNCLGSSSSESVDLRKKSHRLSTINENNENNLPKAKSYRKLRNSFLGNETNSPIPVPSTNTPLSMSVNPSITDEREKKKSKVNKKEKIKSTINPTHLLNLETHPKMVYDSNKSKSDRHHIAMDTMETGETINMELLQPLVNSSGDGYRDFDDVVNYRSNMEVGLEGLPGMDFNLYTAKKNISSGLIDIALLTANFSQLKFILSKEIAPFGTIRSMVIDWSKDGSKIFNLINLLLISVSIGLQICIGMALLLSSRLNLNDDGRTRRAETCNTLVIVCVFIVTVINIFIVIFLDGHQEYDLI